MSSYRVISQDNHVIEPYDLWTSRAESKFAWRVPHVESLEEGDVWFCDGLKMGSVDGGSANVGDRFEDPENKMSKLITINDVRPGGYLPEEHVKDLDIDGQDVSIVYPTKGFLLFAVPDGALLDAICRSYNDWVGEFCGAFPKRIKGIAMINTDDVQVGVKELERCAKMGFVGAMIASYPSVAQLYDNPAYEPFWAAAQDLEMPLSLHISCNRYSPSEEFADPANRWARPAVIMNYAYWPQMSLADIIFSGVFERYPKLQVGSVEYELSWATHFLDRLDYTYTDRMPPKLDATTKSPSQNRAAWSIRRPLANPMVRFKDGVLPSDFFHSNVFLGFQEDALGIRDRHIIGVDNLQWGSDYPHTESTFPRSREILENILADCTEEEKAKIVGGNAERIYRLD
jgi:predicted TIM-barrel fold metal-dependent hydrolase